MAVEPMSPGSPTINQFRSTDDDPFGAKKYVLSEDQLMLLYLLSKHASPAETVEEHETWIRENQLLVLIYEGILAGQDNTDIGFQDYDYAPTSVLVGHKREWLNISQEGKDDIDDMREHGLVNGLKLSTEELQSVTAYQVSFDGMMAVRTVSAKLREAVDGWCYTPIPWSHDLITVRVDDPGNHGRLQFMLETVGNYRRKSEVTSWEDVSYVSSPYLPANLLSLTAETLTSNKHRAIEAARGKHGIKDAMDEMIILSGVRMLVGEWVPFGSNQMVAMNERLGASDRCKGGKFTDTIDHNPDSDRIDLPTGLTDVRILDHHNTRYVNFEAEVNYPEGDEVEQIEFFGMHFNKNGSMMYGLEIESINSPSGIRKADDMPIDLLCRIMVDVHQDSSKIVESLLSPYQRSLLAMVFMNDEHQREKFNVIMADSILPSLRAGAQPPERCYLDGEGNECELKQILGDIDQARDLGPHDVMLLGKRGMLLAGPNVKAFAPVVSGFMTLLSLDMFIQVFFIRTFILSDTLNQTREAIDNHTADPNSIPIIRRTLSETGRHIVMLLEVLEYLSESVESMEPPPFPKDVHAIKLYGFLEVEEMLANLKERVKDLGKNVSGARQELENLQMMMEVINNSKLEELMEKVEANTKDLVSAGKYQESTNTSLEVMLVILGAALAFDLVDRFTGLDLNVDPVGSWREGIIENLINVPGMWFFVNMLWCGAVVTGLLKLLSWLEKRAHGDLIYEMKELARPVDLDALWGVIGSKPDPVVETLPPEGDTGMVVKMVSWTDVDNDENERRWEGPPPRISLLMREPPPDDFDSDGKGFLDEITITYDKQRGRLAEKELGRVLMGEFDEGNALLHRVSNDPTDLMTLADVQDIVVDQAAFGGAEVDGGHGIVD